MAKITKKKVSLVKFQGEYFPHSEEDYRFLRERSVSVFRISEATLDILSKLLLKGVTIEQLPWRDIYPTMIESFKSHLTESIDTVGIYDFKHERNWLMVRTDTSDEDNCGTYVSNCSRYCNQLAEFMGRYGIRTKSDTKVRDGYQLTRLTFVPDENIVSSFYFGCKDDYNAPLQFEFNLSPSARLKFSKRLLLNNEPTFSVSFEDRFGDHYEEAFSRGFPFSMLKAKDCETAINFFVEMHNRLTIKRKV